MSGSTIGDLKDVAQISLIEQAKAVLKAGGTVYLGESHHKKHGREICLELLRSGCVQFLCLEFPTAWQTQNAGDLEKLKRIIVANEQHNPPITMDKVIDACVISGANLVLMDGFTHLSTRRQLYMRDRVTECRKKISVVGRGVLVLIGSEHLATISETTQSHGGSTNWHALHELIYTGLSFMYGKYKSCLMVWQLS
jgi:hypothetical protein